MNTPSPDLDALLIGIDDTDNLETRGTGFRARQLAAALEQEGLARASGVTRHQLLVDDRVPYTSHNSSACLQVGALAPREALLDFCRAFLLEIAAEGSDVGLCIAAPAQADEAIDFALSAKAELVGQPRARATAERCDIALEGLTGTRDGIIGALAAVGLFRHGDDGRYIWLRNIRELHDTCVTIGELRAQTGVDAVAEIDGPDVTSREDARVSLGSWARPVRVSGRSVLLVERSKHENVDFEVAAKHRIKAFRP